MKNLATLLTVCLLLGAFVSCTTADADGLREASVAEAVQELSAANAASISLDQDDVRDIFDKARELYKTSDSITLSSGETVIPVDVENINLAYAQSLNPSNNEVALEAYETYLSDVSTIAMDMFGEILGEARILNLKDNLPDTVNVVLPDYYIALDITSSGSEHVGDLVDAVRGGEEQYLDDLLIVWGNTFRSYDDSVGDIIDVYPTVEEAKIEYALRNPSSGDVVQ